MGIDFYISIFNSAGQKTAGITPEKKGAAEGS
jgi:hypothetical protein